MPRRVGPGRPATEHALRVLWLLLVAAAAGTLVADRIADLPVPAREIATGSLLTLLAWGLAVRTGGRPWWAAVLAAGMCTLAFAQDWDLLLAGGAVAMAVVAGTLAVMATVPAASFRIAIREVLIATGVAAVGAVGVAGFDVGRGVWVDIPRFGYAVLAFALIGAILLVFRLGAGLHGLGRRGYVVAGGALLMLAIALAYSEALAAWGSPELIDAVDTVRNWFTDNLRAVPHPIAALLGYPALTWGVFMRARRRQGWWVCAFGVAATATACTRLVDPAVSLQSTLLGATYSLIVGLALGYVAIRVEQSVTGSHGRRARRGEEAAAHRPEPGRMAPLH